MTTVYESFPTLSCCNHQRLQPAVLLRFHRASRSRTHRDQEGPRRSKRLPKANEGEKVTLAIRRLERRPATESSVALVTMQR
eukprot:2072206-Prymnesium_polylepis.2